jgi:hypothetical protein
MKPLVTLSACALILFSTVGIAQSDREETWEFFGSLLDLSSASIQGANGSSLLVDDETGWGFGGAYNFTNRFSLGFDINYSDPAYVATLVPDGIGLPQQFSANLGLDVIHIKGIFNILDSEITPFIEVGGGWTYVDSNIVEGYSGSACWWDPWWGYICNNYYDTYTDTHTSHSYALGIRWETDSDIVLRASWGVMDIDTGRSSEDIELDTIQLTFGYRF